MAEKTITETEKNMSENTNKTETEEIAYVARKRLLFLGLPWTFTKYTITPSMLTVDQGLFKTVENDCYMYKIQDVRLTQTLGEKIFGLGTVECFSGDATDPNLKLVHIRKSKEIKNYILEASEKAKIKRRTVTTYDIGMDADEIN